MVPHIGPSSAAIARYDGILTAVSNPHLLLGPLTTQEAVLSSRIEGTQATMGEVFEYEANRDSQEWPTTKKDDIHEVLNYRKALRFAEKELESLPLSNRLIRAIHKILMQGVRGQNKDPGEFVRFQLDLSSGIDVC